MSEEKTIRLSKVIKEFNLSLDHIVGFLSTKGVKIDSNPNSKLPGDAYALLIKEFQSDRQAKEEAKHITDSKQRKDAPVVLDASSMKQPQRKEAEDDGILIKNLSSSAGVTKEEKPKAKKRKNLLL